MNRKTTFTIKAGRRDADKKFRFMVARNGITFRWKINHAAYYDYHKVINTWHRIIEFLSPGVSEQLGIYFTNSSSGLIAEYRYSCEGVTKNYPIGLITPGIWYKTYIFRKVDSFEIEHGDPEGDTNSLFISAPFASLPPLCSFLVYHPRLLGRFTLDRDLIITIQKL